LRYFGHTLIIASAILILSGCSFLHIHSYLNKPKEAIENGPRISPGQKSASLHDKSKRREKAVFVGVGISGGGSRAANFGAAGLEFLDQLGIMKHVTNVSSVSGGSLPAAYYSFFKPTTSSDWATFKSLMATDFYSAWLWRLFLPHKMLMTLFTDYDYSDVMAEVFDHYLFKENTFGSLRPDVPALSLNATSYTGGRFVFNQQFFDSLNSALDSFPVSHAVMASAAFPAVFNNITLRDFLSEGEASYLHLFDGGPSGNLGVETLLWDAATWYILARQNRTRDACLLILIDAFPGRYVNVSSAQASDTRVGTDFLLNRNALRAFDSLLFWRRVETLQSLNFNIVDSRAEPPISRAEVLNGHLYGWRDTLGNVSCLIWHISFSYLDSVGMYRSRTVSPADPTYLNASEYPEKKKMRMAKNAVPLAGNKELDPDARGPETIELEHGPYHDVPFVAAEPPDAKVREQLAQLREFVGQVETHFKLVGPRGCASNQIQDALYEAARLLILQDTPTLRRIRRFFQDNGIELPELTIHLEKQPLLQHNLEDLAAYDNLYPLGHNSVSLWGQTDASLPIPDANINSLDCT